MIPLYLISRASSNVPSDASKVRHLRAGVRQEVGVPHAHEEPQVKMLRAKLPKIRTEEIVGTMPTSPHRKGSVDVGGSLVAKRASVFCGTARAGAPRWCIAAHALSRRSTSAQRGQRPSATTKGVRLVG